MAVGQKPGSRRAGGESAAVRGEDGHPGAASVDGLLARVAHGDVEAFAGVYAGSSGRQRSGPNGSVKAYRGWAAKSCRVSSVPRRTKLSARES